MSKNTHVQKFIEEQNAKIDNIIGNEITFDTFMNEVSDRKGQKYRIHNGWSVRNLEVLSNGRENHINSGIITGVHFDNDTIFVELENDNKSEKFTTGSIKKVTQIDNKFYVIYHDNSYFKIVVE